MLKNNLPKASVIIPIYNAENTLHYCIDSILKQTYKNFEIILINDGSRDKSLNIMKEYKKRYPDKIQIYDQPNQGVAETRNRGIKYSRGKYLFFVDNDDYIDNNYIETFIDSIEKTNADVVIGGYRRVKPSGKIIYKRDLLVQDQTSKFSFIPPWARVYRKKAITENKIKFLDINIGDDLYFNMLVNLKLKVVPINYTGYNWVDNKLSVSNTQHKGFDKSINFLQLLENIQESTKTLKKTQLEKNMIEYFFIKTILYYILHSGRGVEYEKLKNESQKLFQWLKNSYPNYQKNKYISPFQPTTEVLSTRLIVFIYIFLKKLHLENIFLFAYSKL